MTCTAGDPDITPNPTHDDPARAAGRPSFKASLRQLASAQKSGKGAPAYSRFVNRRLGRVLAAAAHVVGLTPNGVTALSATCTFSAIALIALAPHTWGMGAVVAGLLVLGYALDAADGQLARLRGGGSVAGEWLDHVVDSLKSTSLHLAVLIGWYRQGSVAELWLLVPIGFTVVDATSFFAQILNEQLRLNRGAPRVATEQPPSLVVSLLKLPTDYGLYCLVFLLLGFPRAFSWAYALLFAGSAAYLALALVKWFGDMRSLDDARRAR